MPEYRPQKRRPQQLGASLASGVSFLCQISKAAAKSGATNAVPSRSSSSSWHEMPWIKIIFRAGATVDRLVGKITC